MKQTLTNICLAVASVATLFAGVANAYPVSPSKAPVTVIQDQQLLSTFTLAYDNANPSIVYFAPKGGRVATMNGMPLVGFALLPNAEGILNAQMEYGVFGSDKQKLFAAIRAAGKVPVQWPFRKTKITPLTPGIDPTTGQQICEEYIDPVTGESVKECVPSLYREVVYSQKGPSLGEYMGITAMLTRTGAAVYERFLRTGNALQLNVDAEYLEAGTAFVATVTVSYSKLFQNFHAYAGAKGFLWKAELESFWRREGLCVGRSPSECGIFVVYQDQFGNVVKTPTIDPNNAEQQNQVFQAVERFVQTAQDQMLAPLTQQLQPVTTDSPSIGYKLNAKFESQNRSVNYTATFRSPNAVNSNTTTFPVSIGCIRMTPEGDVFRSTGGDCGLYWQ